jgi:hypothetical protein
MVWGVNGYMNGCWNANATIQGLDFAGGTVVHMSSGWSGLVLCIILGKRIGFGKENFTPHSIVLTYIGASMLWVGWYGFNSGSAVAGDIISANAFTTTTLATAVGSFVWPMWEWIVKGKPSVLGFCSGAVAGLVLITPACGYVLPSGAMWIGIAAGTIPWFFCYKVKGWLGMDDALDAWSVHGIGGMCGAIMTGMFARNAANPNLATNLSKYVTDKIFQPQLMGAVENRRRLARAGSSWAQLCALSPRCSSACVPSEEVEIVRSRPRRTRRRGLSQLKLNSLQDKFTRRATQVARRFFLKFKRLEPPAPSCCRARNFSPKFPPAIAPDWKFF